MDLHLKGATAVITGASQGIGRAIAKELAIEGVKIFATGRNETLLNSLRDEVIAAGSAEPFTFVQDLIAPDAPENIASTALARLKYVDILVNNAGRSNQLDVVGAEECARHAGVLGSDERHLFEDAQGAQGDVFQVADGRGHEVQRPHEIIV